MMASFSVHTADYGRWAWCNEETDLGISLEASLRHVDCFGFVSTSRVLVKKLCIIMPHFASLYRTRPSSIKLLPLESLRVCGVILALRRVHQLHGLFIGEVETVTWSRRAPGTGNLIAPREYLLLVDDLRVWVLSRVEGGVEVCS